jgi:isopentenyl phosphate kinase
MDLAVVKLDGSLFTAGSAARPEVRVGPLYALAESVRGCGSLVLVHGSGSFGKTPAVTHGWLQERLARESVGVLTGACVRLEELHRQVVAALRAAGVPAFSVQAAHAFAWAGGVTLHGRDMLRRMLARGLVPVVASGFVPDLEDGGFAVAPGDAMAAHIAIALRARRLVFATRAHGACQRCTQPDASHEGVITEHDAALDLVSLSRDGVSGGLRGTLEQGFAAARHGITTLVVDGSEPRNVAAALRGAPFVGTRLVTSPRASAAAADALEATR